MSKDAIEQGILFLLVVIVVALFAFFAWGGEMEEITQKLVCDGRLEGVCQNYSLPPEQESNDEMIVRWLNDYCRYSDRVNWNYWNDRALRCEDYPRAHDSMVGF